MATIISRHMTDAEVNAAIEMGGFATSPGPMHGIAVAESTNARDGFSGPTVASMPAPTLYATGWKWIKDPYKSYGYHIPGTHMSTPKGYWKATGWTTDPTLAVPQPTYKDKKGGRGMGPG